MKKVFLGLALLLLTATLSYGAPANIVAVLPANDVGGYVSGTGVTGSAGNAFPAVGSAQVSWNSVGKVTLLGVKSIFVMNADGADGLEYYMTIKATAGQDESAFPGHGVVGTPIALVAGADTFISFSDSVAEVNIYIRNTVADSIADWAVFVSGRR